MTIMMKKILLIAVVAALFTGCSKDDPTTELPTSPTEKPTSVEETVAPPTIDELKAYFAIINTQNTYQVSQLITGTTGEKNINGKIISISQSTIETRNDEEGSITVKVSGKTGNKDFSKSYTFDGLAKKPSNYYMAIRANLKWKEEFKNNPEGTSIAFDELYRLKQTEKFTAKYLSQWIDFYSSNPEGNDFYTYTAEDIDKTELSDVTYENGSISFVITYSGVRGKDAYRERPSIRFDKNLYYKHKVTLNMNDTKQYYMQGVYQNLESFYGNAINIEDDKTFVAELIPDSKIYDNNTNTINCQLSFTTYQNADNELARFEFKLEGFKPLTDLKNEWVLATKQELNDYMAKKLSKVPDGDVLDKINRYPISRWIKMAQIGVRRDGKVLELYPDKETLNNIEVEAWIPVSRRVIHSDILWLDPRFEIVSAQKTGNRLTMQIALTYVNEVALDGVVTSLDVTLN